MLSIFEEWYGNLSTVISRITKRRFMRLTVEWGKRSVDSFRTPEKFGRMSAISTYLRFKSRELSFLAKLFSPRHKMANFLMLRAWSYLSIYFSAEFMTCFVTVWTELGCALKGLHLTLTSKFSIFVSSDLSSGCWRKLVENVVFFEKTVKRSLSIDKSLMIDYICNFTIHRKSSTDSS